STREFGGSATRCCPAQRRCVAGGVLADVRGDPGAPGGDPGAHGRDLIVEAGTRRQLVVEKLDVREWPAREVVVDPIADGRQVTLDARLDRVGRERRLPELAPALDQAGLEARVVRQRLDE